MQTATVTPDGTQAPSPTAWIDAYVAWASKRSPLTPPHFHENIAYTLAACAIAGRLCIQTAQGRIYPNQYTLLLAKTTVYAKTVAMDLSQEVAEASNISDRVFNSIFTPESIIGELSGEKPTNLASLPEELQQRWRTSSTWRACRLLRLDEAGVFFNGMRRDYNAGMQDLWMKLYDCPATVERTTYKHGLHVIQQPVLSCLFATTPASIGALLRDPNMWLQGFWPRWNFCVGAGYPAFEHSEYEAPNRSVCKPLGYLGNDLLSYHTLEHPLIVPVDPAVIAAYETTYEDNRKRTFETTDVCVESALGRLHTKRMKLALILAALNSKASKDIRVTLEHWNATAKVVRQMELDLIEALQLSRPTEKATREERIFVYAKALGGKVSVREVQRHIGDAMSELYPSFNAMKELGLIRFEKEGRKMMLILCDAPLTATPDVP